MSAFLYVNVPWTWHPTRVARKIVTVVQEVSYYSSLRSPSRWRAINKLIISRSNPNCCCLNHRSHLFEFQFFGYANSIKSPFVFNKIPMLSTYLRPIKSPSSIHMNMCIYYVYKLYGFVGNIDSPKSTYHNFSSQNDHFIVRPIFRHTPISYRSWSTIYISYSIPLQTKIKAYRIHIFTYIYIYICVFKWYIYIYIIICIYIYMYISMYIYISPKKGWLVFNGSAQLPAYAPGW